MNKKKIALSIGSRQAEILIGSTNSYILINVLGIWTTAS